MDLFTAFRIDDDTGKQIATTQHSFAATCVPYFDTGQPGFATVTGVDAAIIGAG